jgi:uncharacterized protein (DUF342 family)
MSADVLITAPAEGGKPATVEEVLDRLKEAGVTFGIDMAGVEQAVVNAMLPPDPSRPLERVRVAQGRPPTTGADARIDYHPCLTAAVGRPKERADGAVDLFDLGLVHNVAKGTALAVMTPPMRGEPGMTVTGTEIPGRLGHEVWLKSGSGTTLSEDKLTVTAAIDGHATLLYGEVAVTNVYQINKDVGVETGNIQFIGSVVIRGNVLHGFSVKAEGDVEVYGGVDGGTVEAAGNVTVQYGITGGGHGGVVAGGSVKARFIESAEVRAGSSVWAAEGILQSRVEAGATVEVMGRRGAIIGGQVIARNGVSARNIGSEMGAPTQITVGIQPEVRQELQEIQRQLVGVEADFQRVDQAIQFLSLQERQGVLPQKKRATLSRLVLAQEQMFSRREALKARKQELEQTAQEARAAWVHAKDDCFPGVRITIGSSHYPVTDRLQRVRFRLNADLEVEATPA